MCRLADPTDPSDIAAWHRLGPRLTTSGQPCEDQLPALAALGAAHVVNLGLHSHAQALADERGSLAALGLAYTHIPVDFDAPTDADFRRFCDVMRASAGQTLHVHCIANLRVSAFLYRYRREVEAMPDERAHVDLERLWRPGGVWAAFVGRPDETALPHRYPDRDYEFGSS